MKYVFIVEHSYMDGAREETKGIGTYGSEEEALAAIERSRKLPGFCNYPDGFNIQKYEMDKDYWHEEFHAIEEVNENPEKDTGVKYLFVLVYEPPFEKIRQIIGVYSSRKKAQAMIKQIYKRPEFFENFDRFDIDIRELDEIVCYKHSLSEIEYQRSEKQNEEEYVYLIESPINVKDDNHKKVYGGCMFFSTKEKAEQFVQNRLPNSYVFAEYKTDGPVTIRKMVLY